MKRSVAHTILYVGFPLFWWALVPFAMFHDPDTVKESLDSLARALGWEIEEETDSAE